MKQVRSENGVNRVPWISWLARIWGTASAALLFAFAFGGREHLRLTAGEAVMFLLFPVGVIAGFVLAWWRELAGGLVTVGCFLLFCLTLLARGHWPNVYFLLFTAPGFLHVAAHVLARRRSLVAVRERLLDEYPR